MLERDDVLGRYTILDVVGQGGMGAVYRARDERLGRVVALKVIRTRDTDSTAPSDEATARLIREARAAASLSHPNIVAIYDVGEHEGISYIAMELVAGASLRALLPGDAPLGRRLGWLRQIAEALATAHESGIVHRDIKPDNVVIRGETHAKVLDFGLARSTQVELDASASTQSPDLATITRDGGAIGTPAYMAPEQIRGQKLDGRCDQFAWGVTAYEVLSGALPWPSGLTTLGLLAAILTEKPAPLVVSGLSDGLRGVIERSMASAADARFESMTDLLRALDEATDAAPHQSSPEVPHLEPRARAEVADTEVGRVTPFTSADTARVDIEAARAPSPADVAAEPHPPAAPRSSRRGRIAIATIAGLALTVLGIAGYGAVASKPPAPAGSSTPSAPASTQPPPTPRTILNEPTPTSTDDEEALALYRKARLLQRDCDWTRAMPLLEQAAARAPDFGEAHLHLAIAKFVFAGFSPDADIRAAYQRAADERSRMTPRDRSLLEIFEPVIPRDPPEWSVTSERLARLVREYPADAELRVVRSMLRGSTGDMGSAPDVRAACELDPDYADAWQLRIGSEAGEGQFEAALRAVDNCHRLAPTSIECSADAVMVYTFLGRCEDAERESRRLVGSVLDVRAPLLLGLGQSRETVEKAFETQWPSSYFPRDVAEPGVRWMMAMADGDFTAGEASARLALRRVKERPPPSLEMFTWSGLAMLAISAHEATTARGAVTDIRKLLDRRQEWEGDARTFGDQSLIVWHYLRRDGLASDADVLTARKRFRDRHAATLLSQPTLAWALVDCQGVETVEEAREALSREPADLRVGELLLHPWARAFIGIALFKGGEARRAIPWLRQAVSDCYGWGMVHPLMDARRYLGEALEADGQRDEACSAYGFVLKRWGRAKPRSVTAEIVRERAKHLGCELD